MTAELHFEIPGMKCGGCVAKVKETLASLPGVAEVSVDLATRSARVKGAVSRGDAEAALARAGYPASAKAASS